MNQGQEQTIATRYFDDSHVDWADFDSIFEYALLYWPETVTLSTERDEDGGKLGFTSCHQDDEVDGPYWRSGRSRHIVRHMLWAIHCGLPREVSGVFKVASVNRASVRAKFESDVRDDIEANDVDPQELMFYAANMASTR